MFFFFFNDTATTEIYTLSLHDALPIWRFGYPRPQRSSGQHRLYIHGEVAALRDALQEGLSISSAVSRAREIGKSTRLNSSHANISYAVFCLKKKKKNHQYT